MAEHINSLILEHLRYIRERVDQIAEEVGTLKLCPSSLESQTAGLHGDNAISHQRHEPV